MAADRIVLDLLVFAYELSKMILTGLQHRHTLERNHCRRMEVPEAIHPVLCAENGRGHYIWYLEESFLKLLYFI